MEELISTAFDPVEEILRLTRTLSGEALKTALSDYHDSDIAMALPLLEPSERKALYTALGADAMSDVFSYLEEEVDFYLSELDTLQAANLIGHMDADDAQDVLEELEEEQREELLQLLPPDTVEEIELIDSYDEDLIGSMMSTNFIVIPRTFTVKEAMKALVSQASENDNISTIYTVTEEETFYGAIDLKDLIVARSDTALESLIATSYPFVFAQEKIEDTAGRLRRYSEDSIPVLSESHRLLGVITAHDVLDMVESEQNEDYARLAGLSGEEDHREPLWQNVRKRLPWLAILLLLGLGVSAVVGLFENVVRELAWIVCFQSLILGMAGNVGTQSLAVTVRVLGEEIPNAKRRRQWLRREMGVATLNGLLLGIFSVAVVSAYMILLKGQATTVAFATAGCVGLALWVAMTLSGFLGTSIPMLFKRVGIDPAVASGPLITTANDLVAVCVYYGLAWVLLLQLPL